MAILFRVAEFAYRNWGQLGVYFEHRGKSLSTNRAFSTREGAGLFNDDIDRPLGRGITGARICCRANGDDQRKLDRKKPDELRQNYRFNEELLRAGVRPSIGVVDDVLTTGSHFRAVKDMLLEWCPDARIVGFFVARRMIPNPFENVSIDDLLK